jgi:hypothetical protein
MAKFSMDIGEIVIGYDAREYWLTFDQSWTEQRRNTFLYRLDILKPLAVDTRVWPTVFESEGRTVPKNRIGFQESWADLSALRSELTQAFQAKPLRAWRIIAITLLSQGMTQNDKTLWESRLPVPNPTWRGQDWTFLGYDVADQWMLSALSNCGFRSGLDDPPTLRAEWGPRLNEFHLFSDVNDALKFKRFSDQRLREDHAPVFVFGLWIVR